jgi:hypothetical protein
VTTTNTKDTGKQKCDCIAAPVEIPPPNVARMHPPEFLRLPRPGTLCPHTGLSRSYINFLILPCLTNQNRPPVRSFVLRKKGAATGVRLVSYESLRNFILAHAEVAEPANQTQP